MTDFGRLSPVLGHCGAGGAVPLTCGAFYAPVGLVDWQNNVFDETTR